MTQPALALARTEAAVNSARLHVLLAEARSAAQELRDIKRAIVISPGHLHRLAQCITDLTDTCQHLHHWGLVWMVAAARQRPGDVY
jgi:hypothetical protein